MIHRDDYICPDEIVKEHGWNPRSREYVKRAMEIAEKRRYERLSSEKNIVLETVFSNPEKLKFLKDAKNKGYKVVMNYIYTRNIEINKKRIEKRVREGGHPVPLDKVATRFVGSLTNLIEAVRQCLLDELVLFDNTYSYESVASVDFFSRDVAIKGKIWCGEEELKEYFKKLFTAVIQTLV